MSVDYGIRRRVTVLEGEVGVGFPAGSDQDILVRSGGSFAALAVGTSGQELVVRSDGTLHWVDSPKVNVKAWQVSADGSDQTTKIQAAATAAAGKTLYFPAGTYGYTSLDFSGVSRVTGEGPERSILKPTAAATSPTITSDHGSSTANLAFEQLSWDLSLCPTLDALYVNNVNKLSVTDCKWRQGRRQLWLGYVSGSKISRTWHMDFQSAGIYVAAPNPATGANPTGQQPNVEFDTVHGEATAVSNGIAADALIWVNGFTAGLSFENIWAIKSTSASTGTWATGIRIDGPEAPSGALGHFALMSAVNTDGIDGPGLRLNNVRQVQYTNSFLSTRSTGAGGSDAGIHIFGTCQDIYSGGGNWISGSGISVDAAAVINGFTSDGDTFPQTVAGGAFVIPTGPTLTNWTIGPNNRYFTGPFVDDATAARVLLAAPSVVAQRASMSPPKIMVSAANAYERIQFYNPVAAQPWYLDVTDTGSGWRILDNAARVIFALVNGGGAQIGNQTGTTNSPITIKKITAQSTAYAGNATLAAGARDKVSGADISIANANMATNDQIVANASIDLPQGVTLKASIVDATHIRVWVENNGTASANVGSCNIRTTVIQYANT